MQLQIKPHDEIPIYRQLESQIAAAIVERRIWPGEHLPNEHEVARDLAISPLAVRKAYEGLVAKSLCRPSRDNRYRVALHPTNAGNREIWNELRFDHIGRDRLHDQLRSAVDFQERLLPARSIRTECFELCSRHQSAGGLAGDFFAIHHGEDPESLSVVVGDVVGKGLTAGLIMATVQARLPFLLDHLTPADVLHDLNRYLHATLEPRQFVALACLRLDAHSGSLEVANAGLPGPLLVSGRDGWSPLSVPEPRLPLGLREGTFYRSATRRLDPGDRLVVMTDGLPEARDAEGEPLGYDRLLDILSVTDLAGTEEGASQSTLESWLEQIIDRTHSVLGSPPDDDWTILAIDWVMKGGDCGS